MCRNIRTLHDVEPPPASTDEVQAAALQDVRKITRTTKPSRDNTEAFDRAVAEITEATRRLLADPVPHTDPEDREVEAARARARPAERYSRTG